MRLLLVVLLLFAAGLAPAAQADPEAKLLADGSLDAAIARLQERVRRAPQDASAFHLLTRAHTLQERWDEAIAAAESAARLEPQSSQYQLELGRAYGRKASRAGAFSALRLARRVREAFQRAVQLDGNNAAARTDLAEFYMEAPGFLGGGKEKAAAEADALARLDPGAAHWVRARLAEKDGDLAAAEKHYRAAAESTGEGYRWLDLSDFYARHKRLVEMEAAVEKALADRERNPQVLLGAAELLLRAEHKLPQAVQHARAYLAGKAAPEAPRFHAHYVLGSLLAKQGQKEAAATEYRAALALARDYPPARQALRRLED